MRGLRLTLFSKYALSAFALTSVIVIGLQARDIGATTPMDQPPVTRDQLNPLIDPINLVDQPTGIESYWFEVKFPEGDFLIDDVPDEAISDLTTQLRMKLAGISPDKEIVCVVAYGGANSKPVQLSEAGHQRRLEQMRDRLGLDIDGHKVVDNGLLARARAKTLLDFAVATFPEFSEADVAFAPKVSDDETHYSLMAALAVTTIDRRFAAPPADCKIKKRPE